MADCGPRTPAEAREELLRLLPTVAAEQLEAISEEQAVAKISRFLEKKGVEEVAVGAQFHRIPELLRLFPGDDERRAVRTAINESKKSDTISYDCYSTPSTSSEEFDRATAVLLPRGLPRSPCKKIAMGVSFYVPLGRSRDSWRYAHLRQAENPDGGSCFSSESPLGDSAGTQLVADRVMTVTKPFALHVTGVNTAQMLVAELDKVALCAHGVWEPCVDSDEHTSRDAAEAGGQEDDAEERGPRNPKEDSSKDPPPGQTRPEEEKEREGGVHLPHTYGVVDAAANLLEAVITDSPSGSLRFEAALFQYELAQHGSDLLLSDDIMALSEGRVAELLVHAKGLISGFSSSWPRHTDEGHLVAEAERWLANSSASVVLSDGAQDSFLSRAPVASRALAAHNPISPMEPVAKLAHLQPSHESPPLTHTPILVQLGVIETTVAALNVTRDKNVDPKLLPQAAAVFNKDKLVFSRDVYAYNKNSPTIDSDMALAFNAASQSLRGLYDELVRADEEPTFAEFSVKLHGSEAEVREKVSDFADQLERRMSRKNLEFLISLVWSSLEATSEFSFLSIDKRVFSRGRSGRTLRKYCNIVRFVPAVDGLVIRCNCQHLSFDFTHTARTIVESRNNGVLERAVAGRILGWDAVRQALELQLESELAY